MYAVRGQVVMYAVRGQVMMYAVRHLTGQPNGFWS